MPLRLRILTASCMNDMIISSLSHECVCSLLSDDSLSFEQKTKQQVHLKKYLNQEPYQKVTNQERFVVFFFFQKCCDIHISAGEKVHEIPAILVLR